MVDAVTTRRLVLRTFTEEDIEPMVRILGEKDVLRYFPKTDPPPWDRVQKMILGLLKHWEDHGFGLWAVESRSSGELMGRCGLQVLPETEEVEVDFILGRRFWRQGFATEAGRASLRHGFEQLGLERVVGIAHIENKASQRVLEKLGMELVEQRQLWGIECYCYTIDRSAYKTASECWGNAAF